MHHHRFSWHWQDHLIESHPAEPTRRDDAGVLHVSKATFDDAEGRRVAVFVNEFGSVDIDGNLIRWKGQIDEARQGTSEK